MTILASLPTITGIQASICKFGRRSMSLSHNADILDGSIQSADRKSDYRFVLALISMALALTVASAIFIVTNPLEIGGPPYP
jgi:hypothetical protein